MNTEKQHKFPQPEGRVDQPSSRTKIEARDIVARVKAQLAKRSRIVDMAIEKSWGDDGRQRMNLIVLIREHPDAEPEALTLSQESIDDLILAAKAFELTLDQLVDKANKDIATCERMVDPRGLL